MQFESYDEAERILSKNPQVKILQDSINQIIEPLLLSFENFKELAGKINDEAVWGLNEYLRERFYLHLLAEVDKVMVPFFRERESLACCFAKPSPPKKENKTYDWPSDYPGDENEQDGY